MSSDSDSDSDWNRELFLAVSKRQGNGPEITEKARCEQMQDCLVRGANINSVDKNGNTVLHIAVKKGYREVIGFIRQAGAMTDICNKQNYTAVTLAQSFGEHGIASILMNPIVHLPTATLKPEAFDNEKPSTSRENTSLTMRWDPSPSPAATQSLKRELDTADEYREPVKKQRKRHKDGKVNGGNTDSGRDEERIARTAHFDPKETYAASGLKRTLHGIVYQWKHLMLVLNRAWRMGYSFRLSTEMDAAEKFDDLVLEYVDSGGTNVHRFVQVKHKIDNTRTIGARDLLDITDGDFSVLKYFVSWRKIRNRLDFDGSESKTFTLCTNIGIDVEGLKKASISARVVTEPDIFLEITNRAEQPPRYKLQVEKRSKLHHTLKSASDLHRLARELADRVRGSKDIHLKTDMLKCYHTALSQEVLDIKKQEFSSNFIGNNDLSEKAVNFREVFFLYFKRSSRRNASEQEIWKSLEGIRLKLSTTFGTKLGDFEFDINNFSTCTEEELSARTELPDDDIDDGEISDFLDGFVLAVNQPDESELGGMIRDEIGHSQFNLPDARFVTDAFQIEILEWFKETGKQSVFLNNENARDIFNEIEGRLSSLITTDLRLEYPEKLRKWGIRFERENRELRKFVEGSNSTPDQILLISSSQSSLTALRVHQALAPEQRVEAGDGFIFIHLRKWLDSKIMDQVLRAFKWRRNHNLLVVDCESINYIQHTQELWNPLCEIMREDDSKRVILIAQGNTDSAIHFAIGYKALLEKDDDIGIKNLKKCSQRKLLERKIVKFQGRIESFGRLLDIHDFDNIGRQKSEALERVIDPITLVQLIEGKEIRVGNEVEGLGTTRDYYISRKIVRHVVIKEDIFEASGLTDLFAIGGVGERALGKLLANHDKLQAFDRTGRLEPHRTVSECIILGDGREAEEFKILCERNSNRNIHWLQGASGELVWIESFGDITSLVAFQNASRSDNDNDRPGATHLNEDELVDHDEQGKIVILSDTAGMGKSTVLTSLARKMKDREPSRLVIRINLTQHTTVLAEEKANRTFDSNDTNGALDFLVDKLSRLDTDLESQIYKTMIEAGGNAALLFDGFDEINPTYGDIVIGLLQALGKLPIKKLFVTTRPYASKALEEKLGIFAHRLQPFSPDDQVDFLKNFWRQGSSENDLNEGLEERLEVRAKNVMNLLAKSISHHMVEFTGVPLQTLMVAEVYRYGSTAERGSFHRTEGIADSDEGEPEFPEIIDLIDLYGKFVDKKYQIYCTEKKRADHTNVAEMEDSRNARKIFFITHEKLALDALFDAKTLEVLLNSQPELIGLYELFRDENLGEERTGIVTQVIDDKPQFVHRTFAEYFAAEFLIRTLRDDGRNLRVREFFVAELFVEPQFKTIRAFLNCHLSGEAHAAGNKSWKLDSRENFNSHGETVYHVAAKESNIEVVRFFINRLGENSKGNSNEPSIGIDLLDYYGNTPLAIAVDTAYNLAIMKLFVAEGADVNWKRHNDETLLHIAVQKPDNLAVVKYLCDKGSHIDSRTMEGWAPLGYAVSVPGNLDVVKYLIEMGADVHFQTVFGDTLLHNAVTKAGDSDVVKYLIEKVGDVNSQNYFGSTPLHEAVTKTGNLDVVQYLVDGGASVNCQEMSGLAPLHHAAVDIHGLDVVKYLCEKGADVDIQTHAGATPLHHAAAGIHDLDIVKYLCDRGANVNRQDKSGLTPLHNAVSDHNESDLQLVEYLCEKGADVNIRSRNGSAPLHQAAGRAGNLDVVKYLCAKGADIHCQDKSGLTPLHCAAYKPSNLDVTKYLCERGADVNIEDQNGETPLHRAAAVVDNFDSVQYSRNRDPAIRQENAATKARKLDVVKYLCERGARVDCQERTGSTPLHYVASRADDLDVVKYLCEKGADVNIQTHDGFTPLHRATAEASDSDIAKYSYVRRADTNRQEKDGETPIQRTLEVRKLDVVKYLIEKGAYINTPAKDGRTPLHLAAKSYQLKIVKFLLAKGADTNFKDNNGETPLSRWMLENVFGSQSDFHI